MKLPLTRFRGVVKLDHTKADGRKTFSFFHFLLSGYLRGLTPARTQPIGESMENQQPVYVDRAPQPRNWLASVSIVLNVAVLLILFVLLSQMGAIKLAIQGINAELHDRQYLVFGDGKDGKYSIAPINSVGMLKAEKELSKEEKEMMCK